MKKLPLIAFLIMCAIVFVFYWVQSKQEGVIPEVQMQPSIFALPISDLDLGFESYGNIIRFYPDNRHLFFTTETISDTSHETGYFMADLGDDTITKVGGVPLGGTESSNYFVTAENAVVTIRLLEKDSVPDTFSVSGAIFSGSFDEEQKKLAINTSDGIYIYDVQSKEVIRLSQNRYDGAYAWIDSDYIFGFRQTKEKLMEAGYGRVLAVWNIPKKTYTDVPVQLPYKTVRFAEWIVPGRIARVNSGFDDGSFDTIVDLSTYTVTDLGDTSGMLMGGVRVDREFKKIAVVGTTDARVYNEKGERVGQKTFDDTFIREHVEFVSDDTIVYIRKDPKVESSSDIVMFDFSEGEEVVVQTIPQRLYSFAITSGRDSLIVPNGTTMTLIEL